MLIPSSCLIIQKEASGEVEDVFPDALREPILRKVQFSTISRIDNLGRTPAILYSHPVATDACSS